MTEDDGAGPTDLIDELVHRADLDGLVRLVDGLTSSHDWRNLLVLRDRARAGVLTGRQLWPAATLAEYRLALHAPPEWAARVLDEESGRFTVGPLTEVVAQHHTLADLAAHLPPSPRLGLIAHERALRGESVIVEAPDVFEMPFEIQPWEPVYPLATYSNDGVDAPSPQRPSRLVRATPNPTARVDDPDVERAVRQLFEPWTADSNGRVEMVCVEGSAADAVGAFGLASPALGRLDHQTALAWLAWAGASGGAHGRRRGAALGRFGVWWLLATLADRTDDWPVHADEMGEIATSLRWWWWDANEPHPLDPGRGWEVRLVFEDADEGYAWAISAIDAV
jgi:hypothetical protein